MSGFWWAGSGLSGASGISLNGRSLTTANDTFTIAANADDGSMQTVAGSYPPGGAATVYSNLGFAQRSFTGGSYYVAVALLGWDTSSLNDGATVTQAQLRLYLTTLQNANSLSLTAEWYDYGASIDAADHTNTPASTAGTWAISSLTANALNTLTLSNPTNVSLTGWTKLRLHVSAATPTGLNQVNFRVKEDGSNAPQLLVTSQY